MIRFAHRGQDFSFLIVALALLPVWPRAASSAPGHAPQAGRAPAPAILADDGIWLSLNPAGGLPPARYAQSTAYDPLGDRMIVFGGDGPLGDTWALSLSGTPTWTNLSPVHAPSRRRGAAMIYDPVRNRVVLFGGEDGTPYNDVWALNLSGTPDWTQLSPSGLPPAARMSMSHAYDPVRDRLVVVGGYSPVTLFSDAWALTFSPLAWEPINATGVAPSARWGTVSFYQPGGDRLVMAFGSTSLLYTLNREVWTLSLSGTPSWSLLTPIGATPPVRFLSAGVYEPDANRMIAFGGWGGSGSLGDLWELTLGSTPVWRQMSPEGTLPTARRGHSAIYKSATTPLVIFGGRGGAPDVLLSDSRALSLGPPGPPVITGFIPLGGKVGDDVFISGNDFDGASEVSFNGVGATILEVSRVQIRTRVPVGATTGPIRVTTPLGSIASTVDFFIGEAPLILAATPDSGKAGASIVLTGRSFATATRVSFGGIGSASFVAASDTVITAIVDTLAKTGPVYVTNLAATGTSTFTFTFIPRNPRPRLIAVRDVRADQGGKLVVAWEASEFDRPDYSGITSYRVWRRTYVRAGASAAHANGGARAGPEASASTAGPAPGGFAASEFWESLAEVPAVWLGGYAYAAETLQDSTAAGNPYTAFFVQALTANRAVFYNSNVDSGYSVDNLAPPQPLPFAAVYSAANVALHWVKNRAPDFEEFRLYRGARSDFSPGPGNLVIATRDTGHVDFPPNTTNAYYKLVAVDLHGNASRFSAVSPESPVATLASLVSCQARADRIQLTWYTGVAPDVAATVYRRTAAEDWARAGEVTPDGRGFLVYDDLAVTPGTRYGYRLGITSDGTEEFVGEAWVTATGPRVALEGARPNPGSSRLLTVWFELPSEAPARLELLDLAGRRIVEREVGSLGPGRHSVNLASGARLPPGVYHVRLIHGQGRETARVAVID